MNEDKWSEWLLRKRFGGDRHATDEGLRMLRGVRDAVLEGAQLRAGQTLLDVGAGDGLIAFGALERLNGSGHVIFADVSQPLLDHARVRARDLGVEERCTFVRAPADDLAAIADESVDAVTTRSVLIYVKDKAAAFREFHRVLRPGGRASIWEPINRFAETFQPGQHFGAGIEGIDDLAARLTAYYRELQPLDTDPMLDFDERDLLGACEAAGFRRVKVDVTLTAAPSPPARWEVVMKLAGNPNIPAIASAMEEIFTAEERARFEAAVRPVVESGGRIVRSAVAHLVAVKDQDDLG